MMRARTLRRSLACAAAVAALFVATVNVAVLRGGRPIASPDDGAPADCVLVLGAGVWSGTPSPVLEDRLTEALDLYREGRARKVLVSGDHRTPEYDEPNVMRAWLEARGVPAGDIFMDHAGLDTYSSMWRAKHVFLAERVIVVTQRFHLPRAVWTARSLGLVAEGSAADRRLYRGAAWFEVREVVSRTKAFVDVATRRAPRHGGPPIPLDGDGRITAG